MEGPTTQNGDQVAPVNGVFSYFQAFDWSEPWLYCVIAFHIVLYWVLYITRRNSTVQIFSFLFLLLTVYMAEDLNEFLSRNYRYFTRHQYFDSNGLFISVVMSIPLLLASAFIAGNWFRMSTELMTQVKVMQLRRQQCDGKQPEWGSSCDNTGETKVVEEKKVQ